MSRTRENERGSLIAASAGSFSMPTIIAPATSTTTEEVCNKNSKLIMSDFAFIMSSKSAA